MKCLRVAMLVLCLFACYGSVQPRPSPQDTVTQTGEPSHFQVDDKAAEIEVNANPAGVKVNAKPASLQVVAKPGVPAIPIFHPAVHLAQHYAAPPVIHRHPALFYHGGCHFPFYRGGCNNFPFYNNFMYNGIKRHEFPQTPKVETKTRTHKSNIPHVHAKKKGAVSRKRQFISAVPQYAQQSSLGALGALAGLRAYRPYGYGSVPPYAPLGASLGSYGLQQSPQLGLFQSPSQLTQQMSSQEPGMSRSLVPSESSSRQEDDGSGVLKGYQKLYSELNSLASLYNALLGRSLISGRGLSSSAAMGYGSPRLGAEGGSLGVDPSSLGYAGYGGSAMGYGRTYIPSPLSQLYGAQAPSSQATGLLGSSLMGQQAVSPYLVLPSMLQQHSSIIGRSKVPGASNKKSRKHSSHAHKQDKRSVVTKRQTFIEPVLQDDPTSDLEGLFQDGSAPDYKRQMILAPAALQQLQSLAALTSQQQLQQLQLRQLQQQLQQQQQTQAQQQPAGAGLQQLAAGYTPLDSTGLRYLTPSLVTPLESPGSGLVGRSTPGLSAPVTSPLSSSSLVPSTLASRLFANNFARPQTALNTIQSLPPRSLLQDRSYFHNPLTFRYPSYPRGRMRRPQYRRRLHSMREYEDEDRMKPELLGKERISQEGSYSSEEVPTSEGETLVNSPVGFGPITVEAKTAEGAARAALLAGEDKRFRIATPAGKKHTKKHKVLNDKSSGM